MSWTFMGTAVWRLTCPVSRGPIRNRSLASIHRLSKGSTLAWDYPILPMVWKWPCWRNGAISSLLRGGGNGESGLMERSPRLQAALFFLGDPLSKALAEVDLSDLPGFLVAGMPTA